MTAPRCYPARRIGEKQCDQSLTRQRLAGQARCTAMVRTPDGCRYDTLFGGERGQLTDGEIERRISEAESGIDRENAEG